MLFVFFVFFDGIFSFKEQSERHLKGTRLRY
jgi:hypothetical protein